jgi:hypothetical protein
MKKPNLENKSYKPEKKGPRFALSPIKRPGINLFGNNNNNNNKNNEGPSKIARTLFEKKEEPLKTARTLFVKNNTP